MESFQFNYNNMDEVKSIFTTASDNQATTTATESFAQSGNRSSNIGQGSVFSPLAPPFQSRIADELISIRQPQQEPRPGDVAPSNSEIDEVLINLRINNSESLFEDPVEQNTHNYFLGSRSESVASTAPGTIWSENTKNNEMFDNFDFLLKTLSSANTYASMLTREQLSVLRSFRPDLLYEFLHEVVRIRTEKRMQRALPHECAFCKNNGENEENYTAHALKDWRGRVLCPVLRAFRCPRCGATGDRAHTIKYCPANENLDRQGSLLRRRPSNNSFVFSENSRSGYASPSTPAQSPSATSAFSTSSFWSNFGVN